MRARRVARPSGSGSAVLRGPRFPVKPVGRDARWMGSPIPGTSHSRRPVMSKRRAPSKPTPQPDDKPVKLTLQISAELAKRFGVHAEMLGLSKSDLFAELVKTGCRRFVVHDHGKESGEPAEVEG